MDCLSSIGTKVQYLHLGQVHWSVPGWPSRLCLRASAHHVNQGVLPGGPHCVLTVGLPLALSRVIHSPLLGSGLVFCTLPSFLLARVGASVGCSALRPAAACALFPGVPLSPLCTPGRRSASWFTLPTLSPVCSLPFRLGAFSFGCGFRL